MAELEEIEDYMNNDSIDTIRGYLGEESDYLLGYTCDKIRKESLYLPGHDSSLFLIMDD